jgi:arginase
VKKTRNVHTDIGIVGAPFAKGQPRPGVAWAPQKLRDAGMALKLEQMGYGVYDYGDLQFEELTNDPPAANIKYPRTIGKATKKISDKVSEVIQSNNTCLTLGGDHSLSIGTVHGHAQVEPDMCLFWIDAHSDINPPHASTSGNIHGMVLTFLTHQLQEYMPTIPGFEWVKPCINAKDMCFIGLRDLDPAERYIIQKFGITCYTMHDIDRHGIDYVLEHAMDTVNPGLKKPIHLSYDIDALDPAVSPSTGTPVPGGLTIREGMYIAEEMALTDCLTGIDLVEVNPELGTKRDQELTLFTAVEIIAACFGKRRKGNVPADYVLPKAVKSKTTT